ncbi:MAG TPA: ATP-binding cassette domain-containing protein [Polyangiaceae bacterium]|nr:ATP-binding cassette domain-containing protein [Polyangiaceae bacterium]
MTKRFGALVAVDGVSLAFEAGRIHAVLGENGAGKTTLLKIAAGLVEADAGAILIDGAPATRAAVRAAVRMVEQHFALAGALTALEQVMLGAEPVRGFGRLDRAAARAKAAAVAREVGAAVDWDARVETMGVGEKQRLEIVRALVRDAGTLILDEPTAALTHGEAGALYATMRRLADGGRAVVVVTHRLDEVRLHADDVSVLRHGQLVSTRALGDRGDAVVEALTREAMNADAAGPPRARTRRPHADAVRLSLRDARRAPGLRGASLTVRAGEIVGVAGVDGNGQRELVRVLAGLEPLDAGELAAEGVAVVHEDRSVDGLVLEATVRDNLVLGELADYTAFGIVQRERLEREASLRMQRGGVVPPDLDLVAGALSGGNQQKIVVERALARTDKVSALVFSQPTRGVDPPAARLVHEAIVRAADAGKAVLVVSADLDELRAIADRIVVLARGVFVADLPPDAPEARFGEAMLGTSAAPRSPPPPTESGA